MSAVQASSPRLTGGIAASLLLHGALIAAFFLLRSGGNAAPEPPTFAVRLLAAPPGERAAGVVQDEPQPAAAETPPPPAPTPSAPVAKTPVIPTKTPAVKPKPTPKMASPAPTNAAPAKPNASAPTAGGGPTGGKGADVANVETPGLEFPYPGYVANITSQLLRRFQTPLSLSATVRFVIRRDGSVDPESIKLVTSSGKYSFDQQAYGAVESAANAKAFGPLPPGFRDDILLVNFRFSPPANR